MKISRCVRVFLASAALVPPLAAAPHMVVDLNRGPNGEPQRVDFAAASVDTARQVVYFAASDPDHGKELWRTDGTEAGTWRLTDVCPGRCDGNPGAVTSVRGRLFFTADDGVSGSELWWSDGTPGSERRVRDLCPGPCGTLIAWQAAQGNRLLFAVVDGGRRVLWSTNGSRRGTVPVATLCEVGDNNECLVNGGAQSVAGQIFFRIAVDPEASPFQVALWHSDGTAAGTGPLRDASGREILRTGLVFPLGGAGLFWAPDSLWRTDGTAAGTLPVKPLRDLLDDPDGTGAPGAATVWNGELVTFLSSGEIVRSDGTPAGTRTVARLPSDVRVAGLAAARSDVFILGLDPHDDVNQLWHTRGTPATTERLLDARPGYLSRTAFAAVGERLLFAVSNDETSRSPLGVMDLWSSDGTAAGTRLIGPLQSAYGTGFGVLDGEAVFTDRPSEAAEQVWRSDGTAAGTRLVRDFHDLPGGGGPLEQTVLGGRLVYSAWLGDGAPALVASDGTAAGTRWLGRSLFWPLGLTRVGDHVFFGGEDAVVDPEIPGFAPAASTQRSSLWWTDGTPRGTARIRQLFVSAPAFSPFGGRLALGANPGSDLHQAFNLELWSSDGRAAGTRMIREIDRFEIDGGLHTCIGEPGRPGPGIVVRGALLFAADDGVHGRELWRTDGTAGGTRQVLDINPGRRQIPPDRLECNDRSSLGLPSNPLDLTEFRGGALFTADDGSAGRELWRTDGTSAGTRRVADLLPGAAGSNPHDIVAVRDLAHFIATEDGGGESLWRTDGTAAGTVRIDDLRIGGAPSWASRLTAVRGRLFFVVYNEATGAELWTSDGDAASTHLVADLRPGAPSSSPQDLTAVAGVLVFAADDGIHGVEPWRSDGTAAGTRRLADIHPGRDASSPGPFSLVGGFLLTGAGDGVHGRELWAIPVRDVETP